MSEGEAKQNYRIEGFSCAHCAGKFEKNVQNIPGVKEAHVNFGASKLSIVGNASLSDIEKAGAFEKLKVIPEQKINEKTYRVEGFSCANCAAKFERNVKNLSGVQDAHVNFGASKLSVQGEVSIAELEQAGAFENLKVAEENAHVGLNEKEPTSFIKKYSRVLIASLFVLFGYLSWIGFGESHYLTVSMFLFSIIIGGLDLLKIGVKNLIKLDFDMKTLMTVAVIGGAIIGEWGEVAVVVILFAISEELERYSMEKARQSIRSLMRIAPKKAIIRRSGIEQVVSVEEILVGDIMLVKPGQKIAMDGMIVKGISSINQASITGESIPVEKGIDDEVFAGTLNQDGYLEVKITKLVGDTTIAKIIHLVEEAQGEKAPAQAFIDRFARYYTPVIMLIAVLIAIIPPLFLDGSWESWVYQALAVLVVGCPCALVISTPIALVSAIGNAARHGVLIKGGIYLEELSHIQTVAFDKTGTLTRGEPVVTDFNVHDDEKESDEWLRMIASIEKLSQHPLASAVIHLADEKGLKDKDIEVTDFASLTGKGVQAKINGEKYYIGNPQLFTQLQVMPDTIGEMIGRQQSEGKTVIVFGTAKRILVTMAIADEIRQISKAVVEKLHQLGMKQTVMLTGDHHKAASRIGELAGVSKVYAELLPEEKLALVKRLQKESGHVAMVGDGVNDAPALASAQVGIAMGGAGTDAALETADIALMGDDLSKLPFAIKLSRKTMRIIKGNITFSLTIKLIALLLVVPSWLTLWIAIVADIGATLIVALNSMRLMKVKE
ncbi:MULTISPECIES: heavy metal translocating P-type ATPase [Cytobacillus]|uniref:Cd(2+)-exporting ATPase n=1 Tax=Cytobacillus kochii TaxID=859143 RepID=A0A248TJN7_9BACI|nr:heavy metal translocating P-type ATPase [Cytobacillus kochii]ASV68371.1 heavy metal translocating P-type ATPase [Cytobacillus kochii]MDQ0186910.1 Cd2+/Zn2+-exporting ATPase [Cytobacillus kochii]